MCWVESRTVLPLRERSRDLSAGAARRLTRAGSAGAGVLRAEVLELLCVRSSRGRAVVGLAVRTGGGRRGAAAVGGAVARAARAAGAARVGGRGGGRRRRRRARRGAGRRPGAPGRAGRPGVTARRARVGRPG